MIEDGLGWATVGHSLERSNENLSMLEEILGTLDAYSEGGIDGVIWAVQQDDVEDFDGTFILDDGDYLEVFNIDGSIRWQGNILLDWELGFQSKISESNEIGQQVALGYWVNGVQKDWMSDDWAQMFFDRPPCRLTRNETELEVADIEEIADE